MDLGNKIKTLRKQKGYSQEVLSEKSGLSLRTIQRIENNEVEARGHSLRQIAMVFGSNADDLLDWGRTEDRGMLLGLNLSTLAFLVVPLLGILLPLVIWISNRNKIQGVDELGKKIINCLLTFFGIYSITAFSYVFSILKFMGDHSDDAQGTFANSASILAFGMIACFVYYAWLILLILINTFRIKNGKKARYVPAIRFLK